MDAPEVAAALVRGALEVHYQPVVMLPGRQVIGFEALARLRDAEGALVSPCDFIPVAEESGLIVELGRQVLVHAVAGAALWRAGPSALATATVSVNVSPIQLEQPNIVEVVRGILADHDVPGSALILEITESTVASPGIPSVIERLSAFGIRIAIDDFGTGFATLDTLRRIPAHMLKLDRSFVAGVTSDSADRAIVRVVADLADSLGMSLVAEGVETEEQADALLLLGCGAMQGYLFAHPGPDPQAAADAAMRSGGRDAPVSEGLDRWPVELDESLLAAARLLGGRDPAHRGAVHAVSTALARSAQLDAQTVRAVGRLALVHDAARLMVDGALPEAFLADDRLRELVESGIDTLAEVALVRVAVAVVNRAAVVDPQLGPQALGLALASEGTERGDAAGSFAELLSDVAQAPPQLVPFTELLEDLDRRRMGRRGMEERMRSVFGITRVLSSTRETGELMRLALEEVRRIVGAASASVERWDRDINALRCLVNVGALGPGEETFPADEVYPLAEYAQARRTMLLGLPYIHRVDDPTSDDDAVEVLERLGKYSSAAVPVYVDGRVWGQLWFATDHGEPYFEARDTETLMAVATLMGGVVAQAENLQAVDRMAFEDALTRVGNRRLVDDVLERLSDRGEGTVLALLDIDGLKEINDAHGHAAGDDAIRQVADALSKSAAFWPVATIGRRGGDEFCAVLPGCTLLEARELLVGALTALKQEGGPSVSLGLAVAEAGPWSSRDLLSTADEDLYRAKRRAHRAREAPERRDLDTHAGPRRRRHPPTRAP
jgi:diguanylate cyclase (GGDEF)-like protein